jgi:hypothetical protein
MVPLVQGVGLAFAILSYADTLTIGITADPALVPDAERLCGFLQDGFEELRVLAGVERVAKRLGPVPSERQRRPSLTPQARRAADRRPGDCLTDRFVVPAQRSSCWISRSSPRSTGSGEPLRPGSPGSSRPDAPDLAWPPRRRGLVSRRTDRGGGGACPHRRGRRAAGAGVPRVRLRGRSRGVAPPRRPRRGDAVTALDAPGGRSSACRRPAPRSPRGRWREDSASTAGRHRVEPVGAGHGAREGRRGRRRRAGRRDGERGGRGRSGARGIPFVALRVVLDGATDELGPLVGAVDPATGDLGRAARSPRSDPVRGSGRRRSGSAGRHASPRGSSGPSWLPFSRGDGGARRRPEPASAVAN